MNNMKETFASKVRSAAAELGRFTLRGLAKQCDVDHARIQNTIYDMVDRGEMKRLARGEYEYQQRIKPCNRKQDVMWRYLAYLQDVWRRYCRATHGGSRNIGKIRQAMAQFLSLPRRSEAGRR